MSRITDQNVTGYQTVLKSCQQEANGVVMVSSERNKFYRYR
jgi:hypothetical protein